MILLDLIKNTSPADLQCIDMHLRHNHFCSVGLVLSKVDDKPKGPKKKKKKVKQEKKKKKVTL